MNKEQAIKNIQSAIKRQQIQPIYSRYLQSARVNYSKEQLIEMSKPYKITELKKAFLDELYNSTLYNKPVNKLKKYELYHELLNYKYDFNNLTKKAPKAKAPAKGIRLSKNGKRLGRPPKNN